MSQTQVKALCLLSGGIDSTTCLARLLHQDYGKLTVNQVQAVSILYGQKHSRELYAASAIARHFGIEHRIIQLPENIFQGGGSTLIDPDRPNPSVTYEELSAARGISPTYVPFRNGNILSAATALAVTLWSQADKAAKEYGSPTRMPEVIEVHYGAHAEDAAYWAYPDCTPEFNGAMANAIFIGSYQRVRLVTPLQWMTKDAVIQLAKAVEAPLELTYSCYNGRDLHCGVCPTCIARKAAFRKTGVPDPTKYEEAPSEMSVIGYAAQQASKAMHQQKEKEIFGEKNG